MFKPWFRCVVCLLCFSLFACAEGGMGGTGKPADDALSEGHPDRVAYQIVLTDSDGYEQSVELTLESTQTTDMYTAVLDLDSAVYQLEVFAPSSQQSWFLQPTDSSVVNQDDLNVSVLFESPSNTDSQQGMALAGTYQVSVNWQQDEQGDWIPQVTLTPITQTLQGYERF